MTGPGTEACGTTTGLPLTPAPPFVHAPGGALAGAIRACGGGRRDDERCSGERHGTAKGEDPALHDHDQLQTIRPTRPQPSPTRPRPEGDSKRTVIPVALRHDGVGARCTKTGLDERKIMTEMSAERREEHLDAEEDDGSAELQPEDGGTAPSPANDTGTSEQRWRL